VAHDPRSRGGRPGQAIGQVTSGHVLFAPIAGTCKHLSFGQLLQPRPHLRPITRLVTIASHVCTVSIALSRLRFGVPHFYSQGGWGAKKFAKIKAFTYDNWAENTLKETEKTLADAYNKYLETDLGFRVSITLHIL
jgi:hypothetical protein